MATAPRFSRLTPDARRAQILDAARSLFATTPYGDVSSARIAEAAGVTRGLLHHYFGGRREVFIALLVELRAAIVASIRTDLDLEPEAKMEVNAASFLDTIEHSRELLAAVLGLAGEDEEVVAHLDATREAIVDRILVNQTGTADHDETVRLAVRAYLGLAESASREWLTHGRATREQVHALLVRALRELLRDAPRG